MFPFDILALAAFETAKISIPTIVDGLRGTVDPRVCDRRLDSWSRKLLEQAHVSIEATGLEHIEPGRSYIVMSNHQSHYDIPVLFQALKIPIRMVAKTELFRIPIMGPGMRASGFVELDRGNRRQAIASLGLARERLLEDHTSLWIAPEGTRSKDGQLLEFKRGGFHLAMASELPILPVTISGSIEVHRAHTSEVKKHQTVRVIVSPAIDTKNYDRKTVRELMETVRTAIQRPLS
jgi:1-acyl-sn-glycerol-3-phosphate acyltransferase